MCKILYKWLINKVEGLNFYLILVKELRSKNKIFNLNNEYVICVNMILIFV